MIGFFGTLGMELTGLLACRSKSTYIHRLCMNKHPEKRYTGFIGRSGYQSLTINIYLNTESYSSRRTWINCIYFNAYLVSSAGLEESVLRGSSGDPLAATRVRNVNVEELAPPCGLRKMYITSPARSSTLHFSFQ